MDLSTSIFTIHLHLHHRHLRTRFRVYVGIAAALMLGNAAVQRRMMRGPLPPRAPAALLEEWMLKRRPAGSQRDEGEMSPPPHCPKYRLIHIRAVTL